MKAECRRGDIYFANLGIGMGAEQQGDRPVIILQNDTGNVNSPTVIVAPLTTKGSKKNHTPVHCDIFENEWLDEPSTVLLEQVKTIDKERLRKKVGVLSEAQMKKVDQRLLISLGFARPIEKPLELCLCSRCYNYFYNTNAYKIRRKYSIQEHKETCTYCNHRMGFDYIIIPRVKPFHQRKLNGSLSGKESDGRREAL